MTELGGDRRSFKSLPFSKKLKAIDAGADDGDCSAYNLLKYFRALRMLEHGSSTAIRRFIATRQCCRNLPRPRPTEVVWTYVSSGSWSEVPQNDCSRLREQGLPHRSPELRQPNLRSRSPPASIRRASTSALGIAHQANVDSLNLDQRAKLRNFMESMAASPDERDAAELWIAFQEAHKANVLHCVSEGSLLQMYYHYRNEFLELQFSPSQEPDCGFIGSILGLLVTVLDQRKPLPSAANRLRRNMTIVMSLTSMHKLEDATRLASEIIHDLKTFSDIEQHLLVVTQLIRMACTMHSVDSAIEVVLNLWPFVRWHYYNIRRGPSVMNDKGRKLGDILRQVIERELLDKLENPSLWLALKISDWPAERVTEMASILIAHASRSKNGEEAFRIYQALMNKAPGYTPVDLSFTAYTTLSKVLAQCEMCDKAWSVYDEIRRKKKIDRKSDVWAIYKSCALYIAGHEGSVNQAKDLYDELNDAGIVRHVDMQMLMMAYGRARDLSSVLEFWDSLYGPGRRRRRKPPINLYEAVLYAIAQVGDTERLTEWLKKIVQAGHRITPELYRIILHGFSFGMDIDGAYRVLAQMRDGGSNPDIQCYTAVLIILSNRRDAVGAERIYKIAIDQGLTPDKKFISALMNVHVQAGSWQGVVRAFDYLYSQRHRGFLDIGVYNILLRAFVLIGAPFPVVADYWKRLQALKITPSPHTWSLLIQSACDAGRMDIAEDLFEELDTLQQETGSSSHINVYVLTIILSGFLRLGDKVRARGVYEEMTRRGIQPLSSTYGKIIKAYTSEGSEESLRVAEEFLKTLQDSMTPGQTWLTPARGSMSNHEHIFTPLMNAYNKRRQPEEVERLYNTMLEHRGDHTLVFLTILLDAYRKAGDVNLLREVWPRVFQHAQAEAFGGSIADTEDAQETDSPPRQSNALCIPLSIYIDGLSKAGLHLEIAKVWTEVRKAGFAFDPSNWNHLTIALVRAGEPERAFDIVERVILVYNDNIRHAERERNRTPASPLLSDGDPQPSSDLVNRANSQTDRRRVGAQRQATSRVHPKDLEFGVVGGARDIGSDGNDVELTEDDVDFAHPLHMLQQLLPTWNLWRPYASTLVYLAQSLELLRRGLPVSPSGPTGEFESADNDGISYEEPSKPHTDPPHIILERIQTNSPRTVAIVERWRDLPLSDRKMRRVAFQA
ncbi:hypothetical protein SISNIDRAFT_465654 [Sistotremastrum niveocremeum HHB9708]|uniref:Pentacotripeptide-repeat region of PRORP domain-containing protein n=2 Tax=Sistotremastraceae TaxID=3402574 RepID=A0A164VFJ2_9AGAM|nr:hypothetical protein SISNIDRAFT_465654 [Sistotremastrum niveocremeum HHB9708]KZT35580.1 hypothetical protein SISSUDRAFT_1035478 [Sistotremastrum suecicum HHB10207 ss-3]